MWESDALSSEFLSCVDDGYGLEDPPCLESQDKISEDVERMEDEEEEEHHDGNAGSLLEGLLRKAPWRSEEGAKKKVVLKRALEGGQDAGMCDASLEWQKDGTSHLSCEMFTDDEEETQMTDDNILPMQDPQAGRHDANLGADSGAPPDVVDVSSDDAGEDASEKIEESSGPFAFVAVLFGPKAAYCIDALVLGECLQANRTEHPYILLHTADVPLEWRVLLGKVGWELREVEYLNGEHLYIGGTQGRFAGVFTKLRALSLFEFSKVVLLDTDLLVRDSIDDLFQRPAPSGMRRHASADYVDRQRIPSRAFIDSRGRLRSGINAGVMVLKPCAEDFQAICKDLSDENAPEYEKSGMPEQDYLTRFYAGAWHHIDVCYNFQPHQIAFTDRRGLENCSRLTMDYEKVKIVHFSSSTKPRDFLIDMAYEDMEEMEYAEEVLLKLHMEGFHRDRRSRYSHWDPMVHEAQLRLATRASAGEWFQHWHNLELRFPALTFLVHAARVLAEVPRAPRQHHRRSPSSRSPSSSNRLGDIFSSRSPSRECQR